MFMKSGQGVGISRPYVDVTPQPVDLVDSCQVLLQIHNIPNLTDSKRCLLFEYRYW